MAVVSGLGNNEVEKLKSLNNAEHNKILCHLSRKKPY